MSNKFFYSNIPIVEENFIDIISNKKRFQKIPQDWVVIVSDIEGSTEAFEDGKYKAMNIISASTVAIAINVATTNNLQIPFIYGGDGSTVVAPKEIARDILEELATLRENADTQFGLTMRVGSMSVEDIYEEGKELLVSKFLVTKGYTQAIFLGDGLYFAEEKIKGDKRLQSKLDSERKPLNLEGLQCHWNIIKPPKGKTEALTLIVQSTKAMDSRVYLQILHDIEEIYGSFNQRHPVSSKYVFKFLGIKTLIQASKIKYGYIRPLYVLFNSLKAFLHTLVVSTNSNVTLFRHDDYVTELVTATDTLKIDGSLKTIVAGTKRQRQRLIERLEQREKRGTILFGYHTSASTTLTCYIHKRNQQYINLIDGTDGGYVQAAKILKAKKKMKEQYE